MDAGSSGSGAEPDGVKMPTSNGDGRGMCFSESRLPDALLADYIAFSGAAGPDPRAATLGEVADGLRQIIDIEGPMIAKRAYEIYLRGCGIRRLGGEMRRTMNSALANAIREGHVMSDNVTSRGGLILSTVRSKGAPAVKPRRRGPRTFEEIPPGELRAVARHVSEALNLKSYSDEHLRALAEIFDLPLMTSAALHDALNSKNSVDAA
jgi:hypothetical protein